MKTQTKTHKGGKTMKVNRTLFLMMFLFGIMLVLPSAMAAVTWRVPTTGSNESTTMTVNVTLAAADCGNCLNASIFYNASGGAAHGGTLLSAITNATAGPVEFYSTTVSISSLTDATTYNFTARLYNATGWVANATSAVFTVDNTIPTGSITLQNTRLTKGRALDITWTTTDATSTVQTVNLSITSPSPSICTTQEFTTAASTTTYVGIETDCTGTYTVALNSTDYAGNSFRTTKTFDVEEAGWTKDGGNTLGGSGDTTTGGTGRSIPPIFIIVGIILIIYFATKKK